MPAAPFESKILTGAALFNIWNSQERILKVVLFLLSLPKDVGLPFLIITTSSDLPLWEAEFSRWDYADIVVYKGNKDVRATIRTFEFYNKQGALMFQILLSHYDAIVEDLEMLKPISWGAVIIDQCQGSSMSKHHSQIKVLIAEMRILVFRQLEDRCDRRFNRCNMLSLLDPKYDKANNELNSRKGLNTSLHMSASPPHPSSSNTGFLSNSPMNKLSIPVKLSNEQIEQYCACLFSNSALLCSCLKNDSPNSLYDILVSTRKVRLGLTFFSFHDVITRTSKINLCETVMKGKSVDQYFDAEIKLSGKLELLDKILQEIKQQGQRVLVLFRSLGGPGVISMGDILDDTIYRIFGEDSYTRISGNVTPGMKKATLNKFNNKGSGKFAILMESRACVPSVKLSEIDIVILFNSDWDPKNDLRSLQKIHDMSSNSENSDYNSCSKILKVQQNGGTYPSKISLPGELEMQRMDDDDSLVRGLLENESPQVFWSNLLRGRVPRWKHLPSPSRGIRRKVRLQGDLYQPSKRGTSF
ncbi:hypothetical protein RND71_028804 [Anisodus tanguticus]|uniref:Uncharacterized protein n=1 Tax=Anisodus tanguticus TaxID=243964 RepID=A0AAE1RLM8_9SOLA|nr:hypothetical protein RND71_028804 [Anisodus tanguticus]